MNGLREALAQAEQMASGIGDIGSNVELAICPPATLLAPLGDMVRGSGISTGGQDCHANPSGAHTGDVSAEMLADLGAGYVIVGHSERRMDHGETDAVVAAKAEAGFRAGLTPIICVGETLAQREAGAAIATVEGQLAGSVPDAAGGQTYVVAYEPVWAIGSGLTPTVEQVAEMHAAMRAALVARFDEGQAATRLLYGGSVKPGNASELLAVANVDGALVGGASLKADDFLAIARGCA